MVRKVISVEDGNLNRSVLITSRDRVFKDIDLSFTAKPNGELYIKKDAAAVKQALKNIIQTNAFEKPFKPFYGGDLRALLFELADPDVDDQIKERVNNTVRRYEPRAEILDIEVNSQPDQNSIGVTITFKVLNSEETVTFSSFVSRLR
jgi:phage baseplate assembly protein W